MKLLIFVVGIFAYLTSFAACPCAPIMKKIQKNEDARKRVEAQEDVYQCRVCGLFGTYTWAIRHIHERGHFEGLDIIFDHEKDSESN